MKGRKSEGRTSLLSTRKLVVFEKSKNGETVGGFEIASIRWSFVPAIVAAFVIAFAMMVAPAFAVDNWAWVSKGPDGTNAKQLVCSSSTAGVVFAGTNGGVYKTTDYGDNWFYSGLRFRAIDALRGSGACNMGLFAGASSDIFQTTDGGGNWNNVLSVGGEISALLVTNPPACTGYAGTRNGLSNTLGRVSFAGVEITALAVDSNNYVYAGTGGNGIWKTTDDGLNWVQTGLTDAQVFSLKIDGSDRIFAGTLGGGVFRSTNGGDNWTQKNSGLPDLAGTGLYVAYSLAKDSGNLYAGMVTDVPLAGSVYKSTDNGDNWNPTDSAIDGYFPESMCTTTDNNLFVGTNMGLFKTDNAGTSWTNQTNKISAIPFRNNFVASNGVVFNGTEGEGVYKSGDGGETWTEAGTGSPRNVGALLIDDSGYLYASASDISGVYKSTNGGDTWTLSSNGLPSEPDTGFLIEGTSFALDGNGDIYVGLDDGSVWKTVDQAGTWEQTATLPSNSANVTAMAGIAGSQTVLAGTDGNGIFRTTNGGTTWVQINTGLPIGAHIIEDSFFVDGNTGYIFVGLEEGGLYRSTNGGDNWALISPLSCDVRSVTRAEDNNLYAVVCSGAVFQSTDDGDTWTDTFSNGLKPSDNVSGINVKGIFAYGGNRFVATESSGMYKFSKDLAMIEGKPDYYASLQDAYNAASTVSTDSILALAVNFYSEDLFFNTPDKSVVLKGGYKAGFAKNPGMTSVSGSLTVSQGDVILHNMRLGSLIISEQGSVVAENVVIG